MNCITNASAEKNGLQHGGSDDEVKSIKQTFRLEGLRSSRDTVVMTENAPSIVTLTITLEDVEPKVVRTLVVPLA